jgi:uncharacterized caspase-like protein
MAYVPEHRHDIFVSFAHVDDELDAGAEEGWVSALVASLELGLKQAFGPDAIDLWRDHELNRNVPLTQGVLSHLRDSALLLVVLSPGYLLSDWCSRERSAFLETVKRMRRPDSRSFIVERMPPRNGSVPEEFSDLLRYRFWSKDENGLARPVSAVAPTFNAPGFHRELNKLVADIARMLEELRGVASRTAIELPATSTQPLRLVGTVSPKANPLPLELHDPHRATGLFVGVGDFDKRSYLARLRFAPDDAIALAHLFVVELKLVAANRACVALGGEPGSSRARERLDVLRAAGVEVVSATRTELLYAMDELSHSASGTECLNVVTFSTHGFDEQGKAYLMPLDGSRRFGPETGLSIAAIHAAITNVPAEQRLLIIDACRGSLEAHDRGAGTMTDDFRHALSSPSGIALLASCSPGQQSWESPELEQGVFTYFLLEGLRGEAPANPGDAVIRLDNIISYTLQRTSDWVRRIVKAEQLPWFSGDENARGLALAVSAQVERLAAEGARSVRNVAERKQSALAMLFSVRSRDETRRLIPTQVQAGVEAALDLASGSDLDELLEMLEVLADGKPKSCKLFMLWWLDRERRRESFELARPSPTAPWDNSLGMSFVPVGSVLFSIWPTRVQDFRTFVSETDYDASEHVFSRAAGDWVEQGGSWKQPGFPQGPTHPVAGISWDDAQRFCEWLTARERGRNCLTMREYYRLPTDEEWSTAVGASLYPWGDEWPPPAKAGRYGIDKSGSTMPIGTLPVGSCNPNSLGIYDLGGNVWEWCDGYYAREMNPEDLRRALDFLNDDGGGGRYRFMRGASWFNDKPAQLRSEYRNTGKVPRVRFTNVGFRVLLDFTYAPTSDGFRP